MKEVPRKKPQRHLGIVNQIHADGAEPVPGYACRERDSEAHG